MRHESLFFLYSNITRIKGVGGATAKAFERLLPVATAMEGGTVPTVRDLLFHLPVGIVDRRVTYPLNQAPDGMIATFVVTVSKHEPPPLKRGAKKPYCVHCSNDTGDITLVFFHPHLDYIKQMLPEGSRRVISGRVEHFDYRLQMPHPDIIAPVEKLSEVQKPEPVYPLTVGLTSRRIGKIVEDALEKLPALPEWIDIKLPSPLVGEGRVGGSSPRTQALSSLHQPPRPPPQGGRELVSWKEALALAHHPQSEADLSPEAPSRRRLAYDEILANQLHLAILRRAMQEQAGQVIAGSGRLTAALRASLPFALTKGQEQVLSEIEADMASGRRMGRLLQGDVGSGKTIVAALAMLRVVEQGLQTALMVPTEIIAQQHYETLSRMVSPIGVQVTLLTGSIKGKARETALADIASGEADIVIGTHALFQEQVTFHDLALVVIDEQHRFGVNQRMALMAKGDTPHLLHLTATPIPRSLTMTLYGDMDCSMLTEKPAERQPITTRVIPLSRYEEIMERLKAALDRGEKAYWICPLIEEKYVGGELELTPEKDIAAAETRFTEFKARFGNVVGLVHGRMKNDARQTAMEDFAGGRTRLLVATTVVEVGVDVRDATIMVIEKAERFGLAQLHQLRGRVGRGDKPSFCVLLYSEGIREQALGISENSNAQSLMPNPSLHRLSILRETEDGFRIAEEDLRLRGGGDLLGSRQSGMPRFIFTDLYTHRDLLQHARQDAGRILAADPMLKSERGQALRILLQLFGYEYKEEQYDDRPAQHIR